MEEVGKLARIKKNQEIANVSVWITSIANLLEIDMESIIFNKYPDKSVRCNSKPCQSNTSREKTVFWNEKV